MMAQGEAKAPGAGVGCDPHLQKLSALADSGVRNKVDQVIRVAGDGEMETPS